jgi:hypothetical protein
MKTFKNIPARVFGIACSLAPRLTLGGALLVAGGNACAQESMKPEA